MAQNGRGPDYQVQDPEFKPQHHQWWGGMNFMPIIAVGNSLFVEVLKKRKVCISGKFELQSFLEQGDIKIPSSIHELR
jgi:hypothetical protein